MKKYTCKILGIWLCLIFSIPPLVYADAVYLKNTDNSIEGIVEKEDKNIVVLNIGCGTITLEKKDIKYIHRSTPAEENELRERWKYQYFTRPEFIPGNLKDLASEFNNLGDIRDVAIESKRERDKVIKQIELKELELQELNAKLAATSDNLSMAKPEEDPEKYNALVNEFNSMVAKIKSAELNKDSFQKKILTLEKKVSAYINDFWLFKKRFTDRFAEMDNKHKEENRYFFAGAKKKLELMEMDFTKHAIDFQRYASAVKVETLLNGLIKANLIVDTGASLVVLSNHIADKLGLDTQSKKAAILVTLADGRQVEAAPVILKTLKVGNIEARNVQAAVLMQRQTREEDGLLGMSFLENFVIRIDAKSNKLILEEFSPF